LNWLTLLSPNSGTVAPGAKQNVNLKFSAKKIPADTTINANLAVCSNDPSNSIVTIPATLHTTPLCTKPAHFTFTANRKAPLPGSPPDGHFDMTAETLSPPSKMRRPCRRRWNLPCTKTIPILSAMRTRKPKKS